MDSLPKDFRDKTKGVKLRRRPIFYGPETAATCHPAVKDFRSVLLYITNGHQHINPLNAELNPICHLLALLGVHRFLHVRRIRVKSLTLRLLMSYIYGAPILDVSRSHTTTQHSR